MTSQVNSLGRQRRKRLPHAIFLGPNIVTGPITADAIQDTLIAFKPALVERVCRAELGHHLADLTGAARPQGTKKQRSGTRDSWGKRHTMIAAALASSPVFRDPLLCVPQPRLRMTERLRRISLRSGMKSASRRHPGDFNVRQVAGVNRPHTKSDSRWPGCGAFVMHPSPA
ncbi:hypothetical protein ABIC11_004493 [Pseudomonas oryzihabitans]